MKDSWAASIDSLMSGWSLAPGIAGQQKSLDGLRIWIGSSEEDSGILEIARVLRELLGYHGATVFPASALPSAFDESLVQQQIETVDLIAMLAVTPGVSAEALEICNAKKNAADKMIVYMPEEFGKGYIYDVLNRKHRARIRQFSLRDLSSEGNPHLCRRLFADALDVVQDKIRKEKLLPKFKPRLAIITALPKELRAVKTILRNPMLESARPEGGIYKEYLHGTIAAAKGGSHDVVLAMAGKGNNIASIRATQLISDYPSVDEIFMVGIAAGVPHPKKPAEHVRLGDVVVCNGMGVIQYDMIKKKSFSTEHTHSPRPPDSDWSRLLLHHSANLPTKPAYWGYLNGILAELGVTRPATGALNDSPWLKECGRISHPNDRERVKGMPRLFSGSIGSANIVLKSAKIRNDLRDRFNVKAIEMEGSGIADATWEHGKGYMIVRGICDFANDGKSDRWHDYASAAAAAFTRELIELMPPRS
jgi:nucleoside phosphorylase